MGIPDSETSSNNNRMGPPDDIGSILWDGMSHIPFFTMFIVFALYILTSTTAFNRSLIALDPSLIDDNDNKSNMAIILTGIFLALFVGIMAAMHGADWI